MNTITQRYIFWAFFKVGILGYGGGPASIPLIYGEVVDHYSWLDADEFGSILALGNTLPGLYLLEYDKTTLVS